MMKVKNLHTAIIFWQHEQTNVKQIFQMHSPIYAGGLFTLKLFIHYNIKWSAKILDSYAT